MDGLISIIIIESGCQIPQYIKREMPAGANDSGFRIYLGLEESHGLSMITMSGIENYLRDMGLYNLVKGIPCGYILDMRSSIPNYPRIRYKGEIFRFTTRGLYLIEDDENINIGELAYPFEVLSAEEKVTLEWSDRKLFVRDSADEETDSFFDNLSPFPIKG